MKKIVVLLVLAFLASVESSFAWEDSQKSFGLESEPNPHYKFGDRIDTFDFNNAENRTFDVIRSYESNNDSVIGPQVEVYDNTTGTTRLMEIDKRTGTAHIW